MTVAAGPCGTWLEHTISIHRGPSSFSRGLSGSLRTPEIAFPERNLRFVTVAR